MEFAVSSLSPETAGDSLLVASQTRPWSKGWQPSLDGNGERVFFFRDNFLAWLLFGVRSTPVLPQWHVKDPGHSAKSAGGRLHHTCIHHWPNEVGVGRLCRCPDIVWESIRKPAHTQLAREHSVTMSQLAEPLWTDPGLKSGISVRELISTWKKKKKPRRGMNCRTLSQILAREEKATTTT